MDLAQAMENLAEGIRSATTARSASLSDLRRDVGQYQQAVKSQLSNLHHENRRIAKELRGKLTAQREHMASEEKRRQHVAQQEAERRRIAKSELRSNTHSLLSRARLQRKETNKALRDQLTSELSDLHSTVSNIRLTVKGGLDAIAADLRGAHEAWAQVKKKPCQKSCE